MQIPSSVLTQQLFISPAQLIRPGQWAVGQLLQATVTGSGAGAAGGLPAQTVILRIGGQDILARSPGNLRPGTQLNLRVLGNGRQPLLQIITPTPSQALTQAQVAAAATRAALPRQGSLAPLLSNLFTLAGHGESFGGRLPEGSSALVKSILAGLPELVGIRDGAAVQRAIAGSGIFLEAKLAALVQRPAGHELSSDLKAALLKLVSAMGTTTAGSTVATVATTGSQAARQPQTPARSHTQPAHQGHSSAILIDLRPGEEPAMALKRQAEAGLARIQLDQLATVTHENPKGALWTLDIPIRDGDQAFIARLHIERDQRQAARNAHPRTVWSVTLEFDMPELGPVHARLSLTGDNLDTRLWAERADTLELIRNFSEVLHQRLANAGFNGASVAVYPGKPRPTGDVAPVADLIDLKA